jgi:hypothetical protein
MNTRNPLILVLTIVTLSGCLSGQSSPTNNESSETTTPSQNRAPSISGSPDSAVMTGDTYTFTPSASDADGDGITFSITNKPPWATFDSATGRLTGQPLLGDLGLYEDITITATDGSDSASLSAFSIEVTQIALGSMTLTWTAPTQNADGSVLTDLAGYKIYYGTTPGNYTNQVRIDNPSVTTYLIENLLPNTYYVVATALNSLGVESRYSSMAAKTVDGL